MTCPKNIVSLLKLIYLKNLDTDIRDIFTTYNNKQLKKGGQL